MTIMTHIATLKPINVIQLKSIIVIHINGEIYYVFNC